MGEWERVCTKQSEQLSITSFQRPAPGRKHMQYWTRLEYRGLPGGMPSAVEYYQDMQAQADVDSTTESFRMLASDKARGVQLLYWVVRYPWPMANREYIFERSLTRDEATGAMYILSCLPSEEHARAYGDLIPAAQRGYCRISEYNSLARLTRRAETDGTITIVEDRLYAENNGLGNQKMVARMVRSKIPSFYTDLDRNMREHAAERLARLEREQEARQAGSMVSGGWGGGGEGGGGGGGRGSDFSGESVTEAAAAVAAAALNDAAGCVLEAQSPAVASLAAGAVAFDPREVGDDGDDGGAASPAVVAVDQAFAAACNIAAANAVAAQATVQKAAARVRRLPRRRPGATARGRSGDWLRRRAAAVAHRSIPVVMGLALHLRASGGLATLMRPAPATFRFLR